jgi:transposase-like protein
MKTPRSLIELVAAFRTEEDCRDALFWHRWQDGFVCPRCGGRHAYPIKNRLTYECAACRYQASVTAGTVFHKTRTPLLKWFMAIHLIATTTKALSAAEIARQLDVAGQTAWTMRRKITNALVCEGAGLGGLVEMDESYVGGRSPQNAGRCSWTRSVVAVMAERTERGGLDQVAMSVVRDASRRSLRQAAESSIAPGSRVATDGWSGYGFLHAAGYDHLRMVQGDPVMASDILPWVHTVISNFKRWVLDVFHGVSRKHLQSYLDEYCYRLNRRRARGDLFRRVLNRCCRYFGPVTYAELTRNPELAG